MKLPLLPISLAFVLVCFFSVEAQKRRPAKALRPAPIIGTSAVVMDETLSLLRTRPSLFADSLQRMRRGRRVRIVVDRECNSSGNAPNEVCQ